MLYKIPTFRRRQKKSYSKSGFTIVELIVIIVVIGILAAISIVSYNGLTQRATVVSLQSDLDHASSQLASDLFANKSYPATEALADGGNGLMKSDGTEYVYKLTVNGYCLSATSLKAPDAVFHISSDVGKVQDGSCPKLWQQVTNGFYHVCSIYNDQPYCWGRNDYGQLGNNSMIDSATPVPVDRTGVLADKTVTAISAGAMNTCVIADGQVFCWGDNVFGQLGNNTNDDSLVPVPVDTSGVLSGEVITSVSVSYGQACAIADGKAYCWGHNWNGSLGEGTENGSIVPVAVNATGVLMGKSVTEIDTSGEDHSCAIANGQAYCWGSNWQLGINDNSATNSLVPVPVDATGVLAGKTITAISTDMINTCVIANGQPYCWGENGNGQIGDNTYNFGSVPVSVDTSGLLNSKTITSISTSFEYACVIADDKVYCWGRNDFGQLGNASFVNSHVPTMVDSSGVLNNRTITAISAGGLSSCAIADSQVYCWGNNEFGQLGSSTPVNSNIPVMINMPNNQ